MFMQNVSSYPYLIGFVCFIIHHRREFAELMEKYGSSSSTSSGSDRTSPTSVSTGIFHYVHSYTVFQTGMTNVLFSELTGGANKRTICSILYIIVSYLLYRCE